jgi:hypothetical protein
MADTHRARHANRLSSRLQVDFDELPGFRGTRMRDADQVNERVGALDRGRIGFTVKRIATDSATIARELMLRLFTRQCRDFMAARRQHRDQPAADVAGGAGYEDTMSFHVHPRILQHLLS